MPDSQFCLLSLVKYNTEWLFKMWDRKIKHLCLCQINVHLTHHQSFERYSSLAEMSLLLPEMSVGLASSHLRACHHSQVQQFFGNKLKQLTDMSAFQYSIWQVSAYIDVCTWKGSKHRNNALSIVNSFNWWE